MLSLLRRLWRRVSCEKSYPVEAPISSCAQFGASEPIHAQSTNPPATYICLLMKLILHLSVLWASKNLGPPSQGFPVASEQECLQLWHIPKAIVGFLAGYGPPAQPPETIGWNDIRSAFFFFFSCVDFLPQYTCSRATRIHGTHVDGCILPAQRRHTYGFLLKTMSLHEGLSQHLWKSTFGQREQFTFSQCST